MSYLVDTNVLSEVRRPKPDAQVMAWLDQVAEDDIFCSVITLGELASGVARLEDSQRKRALAAWLTIDVPLRFGARLLPIQAETAMIWGKLTATRLAQGRPLPAMDGWIAATAMQHDLCVVTRNVKDFSDLGLRLLDPWKNAK